MLVCYLADPRDGNELLRPLRALKPQEDNVRVMSYLEAQSAAGFLRAPVAHFQTDLFLPELSAAAIATITAATNDAPPNTRVFIVPLYGAITRVGLSDTAFALRQPGYELDIVGLWNTSAEKASAVQWVKSLRDSLQPFAHGVYVNQLGETSDELGPGRRTGRTTLGWWRSRKSTTPGMCCGSTRTSSRIRPRIAKRRCLHGLGTSSDAQKRRVCGLLWIPLGYPAVMPDLPPNQAVDALEDFSIEEGRIFLISQIHSAALCSASSSCSSYREERRDTLSILDTHLLSSPWTLSTSADLTRCGVNGKSRSRAPVASKIAFPIAAGVTVIAVSPAPVAGTSTGVTKIVSTVGIS